MRVVQDKSLNPLRAMSLTSGQVFYATDTEGRRTFFLRGLVADEVKPHVDTDTGDGMLVIHLESATLYRMPHTAAVSIVKPRMAIKGEGNKAKPSAITNIQRFRDVKTGDVFYQRLHGVRYYMRMPNIYDAKDTDLIKFRAINLTTGTGHDFNDDEPVHIVDATLTVAA